MSLDNSRHKKFVRGVEEPARRFSIISKKIP